MATPRSIDHRGAVDGGTGLPEDCVHLEPRSWRWLGPWRERGETWDARALVRRVPKPIDRVWERHALFVDAGMRLARERGIPRVVELNAPLSLERTGVRRKRYAARVEAESLRSADRVLAVSRWLVDWAVELGCEPDRVVHCPNGTDVGAGDRERGRLALGVDGPVAVWVGSCKPWHGLERLVPLAEAHPQWTVVVAGTGPTPVPAHPRIRAVGRVVGAALDDLLAAADVGLSTTDPAVMPWVCPLKIVDYRAAGLPVLATPAGDSAELVAGHGQVTLDWSERGLLGRVAACGRSVARRSWADVVAEAS